MTEELKEGRNNGIATLTLNRPESRNALTPEMMMGLIEALPRLAEDPTVRVVVLTGAGRAFWRRSTTLPSRFVAERCNVFATVCRTTAPRS